MCLNISKASRDEGTVGQKNDPADQTQSMVVTDRSPESPYKIQSLLRACVYGKPDKDGKPALLMLADYSVKSAKQDSVFSSVDTYFDVSNYPEKATAGQGVQASEDALPNVHAYAPLEVPLRSNGNGTDVEVTQKGGGGPDVGPKFP